MLKEKVALEFEDMEEAIEVLKKVHERHEDAHEKNLIFAWLKPIIEKIEGTHFEQCCRIENFEEWGVNEKFFVSEKYEKDVTTGAGADVFTERLRVHVEMNTEELELELQLDFNVEIVNLIDAPFRHDRHGVMKLNFNFK